MRSTTAVHCHERQVGRLRVQSFGTRRDMAASVGQAIGDEVRQRLARQAAVRMIFAAAPSQADTLESLRGQEGIDWTRVTAFHMDEYIGLPAGSPSLGELLNQGKNNIQAPWLGFTAFFSLAIMLSLLVFVGEAVRDAFDPRKVFK